MKRLTNIATLVGLIFLATICTAQVRIDTLHLTNGMNVVGTIIDQVPDKYVSMRSGDGKETVYPIDDIDKITFGYAVGLTRDLYNTQYFEFGAALGTPSGANLVIGSSFGSMVLRASGMMLGSVSGAQGNLGIKLSDKSNFTHSIGFIFGTSRIETQEYYFLSGSRTVVKTWTYFGLAYDLNWRGFFLEAGITGGSGSYSSPQIAFQIGYVYRFLPD